jgi:dCMP deaminase
MPDQKKMDQYRLLQAAGLAQFSTCTRRQVGAVLVNREGKIVGEGYNGVSSGEVHCVDGGCPRGLLAYSDVPAGVDYNLYPCRAIHAEHNAILLAGVERARGGTIYVTDEPCTQCSVLIKHVGIERVVVK